MPVAIISIVDEDRVWFKARHGLDGVNEIDRDPGLCASAILTSGAHVVLDASLDPRSMAHPLVAGAFGLRFYAAAPLTTEDGYNLGTLCVIDREPRAVDPAQIDDLRDLAALVVDQMELRLTARRARAEAVLMAKEVDHRVMNSLQFISNILALQSREAGADAAVQLQGAANRVAAVARVHHNFLLEAGDLACLPFLQRLCADLSNILDRKVDVSGDPGEVPSNQIQPIGLLVSELVTNAAKHSTGAIDVRYRVDGDEREVRVADEGPGLPADFDPASSTQGWGMRITLALAEQLGGQLELCPGALPGACFMVRFPAGPDDA